MPVYVPQQPQQPQAAPPHVYIDYPRKRQRLEELMAANMQRRATGPYSALAKAFVAWQHRKRLNEVEKKESEQKEAKMERLAGVLGQAGVDLSGEELSQLIEHPHLLQSVISANKPTDQYGEVRHNHYGQGLLTQRDLTTNQVNVLGGRPSASPTKYGEPVTLPNGQILQRDSNGRLVAVNPPPQGNAYKPRSLIRTRDDGTYSIVTPGTREGEISYFDQGYNILNEHTAPPKKKDEQAYKSINMGDPATGETRVVHTKEQEIAASKDGLVRMTNVSFRDIKQNEKASEPQFNLFGEENWWQKQPDGNYKLLLEAREPAAGQDWSQPEFDLFGRGDWWQHNKKTGKYLRIVDMKDGAAAFKPVNMVLFDGGTTPKMITVMTAEQQHSAAQEGYVIANNLSLRAGGAGRGAGAGGGISPVTKSYIEKKLVDMEANEDRLLNIQRLYREGKGVLTNLGKVANFGMGVWDKIGLPTGQTFKKYTEFLTTLKENLNRYIKEITGAQMSAQEAERLIAAMPNDKDGPVRFRIKLDAVLRANERSVERYNRMLSERINPESEEGQQYIEDNPLDDPIGAVENILMGDSPEAVIKFVSGLSDEQLDELPPEQAEIIDGIMGEYYGQ